MPDGEWDHTHWHRIISNGRITSRGLLVNLLVSDPCAEAGKELCVISKIDTGASLSDQVSEVGLVGPRSCKQALGLSQRITPIPFRGVGGEVATGESYTVNVQLVGDDKCCWPAVAEPTGLVLLDGRSSDRPYLIAAVLWRRWRIEIDGRGGCFSIWVPDNEVG